MMHSINLGIDTEVLYVGSTDDPARRPLKRDHRGYSDSLYGISTAEKDVFVYYNLFKALSITKESPYALHFILGNSMIDEVQKKKKACCLSMASSITLVRRARRRVENRSMGGCERV